ncbi:MAG: hypothetical protein V4564_20735 [Pseudomonadota bacterium]|uniref:hypothetical protein n=1 Tax=Sphingomonas sp. ERG5 TaxID=1381597 RepID=UPI001269ECCD|nr:hypothetical protein [Sphingomonas sp. ERG5]
MTILPEISRFSRSTAEKLPCGSIKTPAAFPADSRRTLKKHFPPETPAASPAAAGVSIDHSSARNALRAFRSHPADSTSPVESLTPSRDGTLTNAATLFHMTDTNTHRR